MVIPHKNRDCCLPYADVNNIDIRCVKMLPYFKRISRICVNKTFNPFSWHSSLKVKRQAMIRNWYNQSKVLVISLLVLRAGCGIWLYQILINAYLLFFYFKLSQLLRLWYLSHRRPAKAQASLRIHAVLLEPSLFAHMKYRSRRRVWPKSDI